MKDSIIAAAIILGVIVLIAGAAWLRFHFWQAIHPGVPGWLFIFDAH